jgi:hypothetical protein
MTRLGMARGTGNWESALLMTHDRSHESSRDCVKREVGRAYILPCRFMHCIVADGMSPARALIVPWILPSGRSRCLMNGDDTFKSIVVWRSIIFFCFSDERASTCKSILPDYLMRRMF